MSQVPTNANQPLPDRLPLPMPLAMLIDPVNVCNFRCIFCPTGNPELLKSVNRPKGIMKLEQCKKVIDSIVEFSNKTDSRLNRIGFYKDGEPLLNRDLEAMIAYAKDRDAADSIYLTTNAALLSRERAVGLVEAGLDEIRISVEGCTDADYRRLTRTNTKYATIVENVTFLFREKTMRGHPLVITAQIIDAQLGDTDKQKFLSDFSSIADHCQLMGVMGWSDSSKQDFSLGLGRGNGLARRVCPDPFSKLSVNFDLTVSVCCVDWSHGTVVGDLSRQTLEEVWQGEELKSIRLSHLRGERHNVPPCADCHYLTTKPASHTYGMDEQAQDLLARYL